MLNLQTFNSVFGERRARNISAEDLNRYKPRHKKAGMYDSYIDDKLGAAKAMINTAFGNRKVDGETMSIFSDCKKLLKKGPNARKEGNDNNI